MSVMTLKDARSLALTLYYGASGKHDLDDHQINVVLDAVNRKYWLQAVRGLASLFAVDSADKATVSVAMGGINTFGFDYSGTNLDANGVYQILAAEIKFLGRYIKLDYEILQDRYTYNIAYGQVQALIPTAYTLRQETMLLLPAISGSLQVRFTYIPNLADLTTDSQQLLNGKLGQFHQLIPYEAAALLAPRDQDRALPAAVKEMKDSFNEYLQSRVRQDGRHIRYVPWE